VSLSASKVMCYMLTVRFSRLPGPSLPLCSVDNRRGADRPGSYQCDFTLVIDVCRARNLPCICLLLARMVV